LQGSTSAVLALTLLAVVARLFFRIKIQKQFAIDDAVLIFGFCILTAAFAIMHAKLIEPMYITVALQEGLPGVIPPGTMEEIMQLGYDYHKWVTVTLVLGWSSIMAAKFSFLLFFWKLIDRIHGMKIYWWAVFVINVGTLGYGIGVYFLACPYFNDPRECKYL
jgi:hypothetical protein